MIIAFEAISGMMVGLEFLEGGVVFDLFILRVMIFKRDSAYARYLTGEDE